MYAVYADGEILYSPLLSGEGYPLLSAKVTSGINKAGCFEFALPPQNIRYDDIGKLKSAISIVSYDEPVYVAGDGEKTTASLQANIPTKVLYKTAYVDQSTGDIRLSKPLNESGSTAYEQYNNYKTYRYFYGDLGDGSQDPSVYRYAQISRTISSGSISITFYGWTYYKQDAVKSIQSREIFNGRVLHDEKDFYNRKQVYCEGELAFLLDSIQRPYSFQGDIPDLFQQYIDNHNEQVEEAKQFAVGQITVTDPNNYINRESSQYPKTLDEINEKLIGTYGGYLRIRMQDGTRYLDYTQESGKTSTQTIEFGRNLLDITEYITAENVFTVLIPLGAKEVDGDGNETRLTIKTVNDGKDYLENEQGIQLFGKIWKVQEWDDVTVADNLLSKGRKLLDAAIEMTVSLTLKAVDLHLLSVETESIAVGDSIRVISPPHGIDTFFTCSKVELDLLDPKNSVYEFGAAYTTLTDKITAKGG